MSRDGGLFRRYVLDTSFLSDLFFSEGSHPRDRFVGLWDYFEAQLEAGAVIAPLEVKQELRRQRDAALDHWITTHRAIFVDITLEQLRILTELVRKYDHFTQGLKDLADPAVVALAASERLVVLTSEKHRLPASPTAPKIPHLCEEHGVSWLGINDYMRQESLVLH